MSDIITTSIAEGINFYYIPDKKYKTVSASIYLNRKLCRDEVTKNALLSKLLTRGTQRCKSMFELGVYADDLYGTLFDVNITKKSSVQSIVSSVNFLNDEYTGESISERCIELMLDMIFKPNLENQIFPKDVFDTEKQNLKDDIESLINDKRSYANYRCIEEMCKGDENSLFEFGYIEDLDSLNAENITQHYKSIVTKSTIDIYVVGDIDAEFFCKFISDYFKSIGIVPERFDVSCTSVAKVSEPKFCEDSFDVAQGKLAMGFTTGITVDDDNYYALLLGNSIYGSGAHSRLFNTVREQMSLCYYASSMLDRFRGIMLVSSGIEFSNYDKARAEIVKQLENIAGGNFTDDELEVARGFVINSYRSYKDSPYSMKEYYRSAEFSKNSDSIDEAIEKIQKITRSDVMDALSDVKLNTVYFLRGKEA